VPYPMEEESDEDDHDFETIPQTKKKKTLAPVYLFSLRIFIMSFC